MKMKNPKQTLVAFCLHLRQTNCNKWLKIRASCRHSKTLQQRSLTNSQQRIFYNTSIAHAQPSG